MNELHDRSISTAIKKLAGTFNQGRQHFTVGEVLSVDKAARTCMVLLENDVELKCRLMAQVGDGFLLIPAVGSSVLVGYFTYVDAYVFSFSDVDVITLKGEELGGLLKVVDTVQRLNLIENKVNEIITNFNAHTHAGSGVPPATPINGTLTQTVRSDIENESVKHGG